MEQIVIKNRSNADILDCMVKWDACVPARQWIGKRDLKQCLAEVEKIGWVVWLTNVLFTEFRTTDTALREVKKLVYHYAEKLNAETDQLDRDKEAELAPIWKAYWDAKHAITEPLTNQHVTELAAARERHAKPEEMQLITLRHDKQWSKLQPTIDANWEHYRDLMRPIEEKNTRQRAVRQAAAIRAIRRRVVVED